MKFIITGLGKGVYGNDQIGPFDGIGDSLLGHENLFRIGGEGGNTSMSYNDLTDLPNLNIEDWDMAFSWGNHADAGYLTEYTETDPVFRSSPAFIITSTNITNWNLAYSWGNHATAGYLTSFTETDPIFTTHVSYGISSTNITNWNSAYGWGDHSIEGYLTSFTETDPTVPSYVKAITELNISNWNEAHGWGNHADEGYLTEFTETDPTVPSYVKDIEEIEISNWNTAFGWGNHALEGYLKDYTETDPIFTTHVSYGITLVDISEWDEAFSWGDHSTMGYLTVANLPDLVETDPTVPIFVKAITELNISNWSEAYGWGDHSVEGYLKEYTETDPTVPGYVKDIQEIDITNWNTAFGWGDHSTMGYLTSYIETDPIFTSHVAYGITSGNLTDWNTAFGWGDHSMMGYLTSVDLGDIDVGVETVSGNLVDNTDPENPVVSRDGINYVFTILASNLTSVDAAGVALYLNSLTTPFDNSEGKNIYIEVKYSLSSNLTQLPSISVASTFTFNNIQIFSNAPKGWIIKPLYNWVGVSNNKGVGNGVTSITLLPADKPYSNVPAVEITDGQNTYLINATRH